MKNLDEILSETQRLFRIYTDITLPYPERINAMYKHKALMWVLGK